MSKSNFFSLKKRKTAEESKLLKLLQVSYQLQNAINKNIK